MKKGIYCLFFILCFIPMVVSGEELTLKESQLQLLSTDQGVLTMVYQGEDEIISGSFTIYSSQRNLLLSEITGNEIVDVSVNKSKVNFEANTPLKNGDTILTIYVDSNQLMQNANIMISKINLYNSKEQMIEDTDKTIPVQVVETKEVALLNAITSNIVALSFDKNTFEYHVNVKHDVEMLDLNATAINPNDQVEISNQTLKEGDNTIVIKVTSSDGTSKEYKVYVKREKNEAVKQEVEPVKVNNNYYKYIIITVCALIGVVLDIMYARKKR